MSHRTVFAIVFVVSALMLLLQFLQTRILSFALWHHFVYIVITMALLGMAASGTFLSVFVRLREGENLNFFFLSLIGFSISSWTATRFATFTINDIFSLSPNAKIVLGLIVTYTIAMVPYFFAGLAVVGSLTRFPKQASLLYCASLLGSGAGCLLFIAWIRLVGGPKLLVLTSLISLVPLFPWMRELSRVQKMTVVPWLVFLNIALFLPENVWIHRIQPEAHKQYWKQFGERTRWEYAEWNPISRVDVISDAASPRLKHILMDGDAQAMLFNPETARRVFQGFGIDRNAAYVLLGRVPEEVLVIGAGGGLDVMLAAFNGTRHIDAVEINPTTARLVSETYAPHLDHLFSRPGVRLFVEDGRSFVRRSGKQYDVITMSATDSLLALSTGAYVMLDNYLYTKEAFVDYLNHLSEEGVVQIGRWFYAEKPRETLRIFSTALEACRANGYQDPASHIVVIRLREGGLGNVLFKKSPFTEEERQRLRRFCLEHHIEILFPTTGSRGGLTQGSSPFVGLAEAFSQNEEKRFYRDYPFHVAPVHDDSPFFYQYAKWQGPSGGRFLHVTYDKIRGIWHLFVLSVLLAHATILSFLFIWLPLMLRRKKGLGRLDINLFTVAYFLSIGFAFMFVELGMVQRFVLFLEHPIYSMAVVIPSLLFFAGLGSLFSHRVQARLGPVGTVAILSGCLVLSLCHGIGLVSDLLLPQPVGIRIAAVISLIAPLAFCMGIPFPLALRTVALSSQETIPWAWAVNGSSSVVASIVAVVIAMQAGFTVLLQSAALFYLIAAVSSLFLMKVSRAQK